MVDFEVAVIGAGAAGLSVAWHLAQAGRRVVILDARDRPGAYPAPGGSGHRPGGRIHTQRQDESGAVELGAEFVHGEPAATLDLMRAGGIELLPLDSEHWLLDHDRFVPMDDEMGDLHELMAMARKEKADRSVAAFLADVEHDPKFTESAHWMRNLLQGFDAADPERASLQSIVREWSGPSLGAGQARPAGGYGKLVDFMVRRLDRSLVELRLGVPVRGVSWSPGEVELHLDDERIKASAVVVTVPLSVLQSTSPGSSDLPACARPAIQDVLDGRRGIAMAHRLVRRPARCAHWCASGFGDR